MGRAGKYTTYNKVRLVLFTHSYACYSITQHLRVKYKIDDRLPPRELKRKYFDKRTIPEISRLSRGLNFEYRLLCQSIILNKTQSVGKQIVDREGIRSYLSIEHELVMLAASRRNKSNFFDPDYESESAVLSTAIERAVGNNLCNIDDDSFFEKQFDELQKVYRKWYYKTANKYKLPTPRIVPFILRLIT